MSSILDQVRLVAPSAVGLTIGVESDRSTWKVTYLDGATATERTAGDAALAAYDPAARTLVDVQADLDAIDAKTARACRDYAATGDKTRLAALESQAVTLRAERTRLSA